MEKCLLDYTNYGESRIVKSGLHLVSFLHIEKAYKQTFWYSLLRFI